MQKNAATLAVVCILLCFTLNCTLPLHGESSEKPPIDFDYDNHTQQCEIPAHQTNIVERTKKMASNIENVLKDFGKNIYDHVNALKSSAEKNALSGEDLRQYEQLVIMKKYPYLDLKEMELNYSPQSNKNPRQSLKFESSASICNDPAFCEPLEDGPNVEITNRGLSGFAIPPQLSTHASIVEIKTKFNNLNHNNEKSENIVKLIKSSAERSVLGSLKDDVREYVEKRSNKLL